MICSKCGGTKREQAFYHEDLKRYLAICTACRPEGLPAGTAPAPMPVPTPSPPVVVQASRRTVHQAEAYRREEKPNIRLIPDRPLVADILYVLAQL